ncbi:DUF3419 family protein [Parapedobacter sp. SGR-10]|uniref:DUF3419 family protein n=1 Tax=Parapedobacter sp. SGR-10 TaxID=2710879 RepID=UPI0013D0E789|nr:DUF3419 family protein [Parapedobacter sp. SGR-10]NGF57295.1 DUF3419 family protein [Parapedobacter sp. SGR-10]
MSDLSQKVDFNFIRYANCWEDADILLRGLSPHADSRILSIASAGDNSFSLLTTDPEAVVAVDVNAVQSYLVELKKWAIKYFTHDEVLQFLGFRSCDARLLLLDRLMDFLSPDARVYWQRNIGQIEKGIIHQGKFERYFQLFARRVLPFIHSRSDVAALLAPKDEPAQRAYYHRHWNTWRWRLFFKIFFSRSVMGWLGRDPQFLKEVGITVGEYIFKKAKRHLQKVQAQQNLFLRYSLTGNFGDLLPHYLQPGNFEKIKANIDKLHIRQGYVESVVDEFGHFDYMNLSNIFEYMDKLIFKQTAEKLIASLSPNGRMAYWNLMVPRRISGIFPWQMTYERDLSQTLTREDNGFFYNQFIVDQKNG